MTEVLQKLTETKQQSTHSGTLCKLSCYSQVFWQLLCTDIKFEANSHLLQYIHALSTSPALVEGFYMASSQRHQTNGPIEVGSLPSWFKILEKRVHQILPCLLQSDYCNECFIEDSVGTQLQQQVQANPPYDWKLYMSTNALLRLELGEKQLMNTKERWECVLKGLLKNAWEINKQNRLLTAQPWWHHAPAVEGHLLLSCLVVSQLQNFGIRRSWFGCKYTHTHTGPGKKDKKIVLAKWKGRHLGEVS